MTHGDEREGSDGGAVGETWDEALRRTFAGRSVLLTVERTAAWYRQVEVDPGAARAACLADIGAYVEASKAVAGSPPS